MRSLALYAFQDLGKERIFFFDYIYTNYVVYFKRFQHVRTVLFKRKLKYLKRMIMKYMSQYIDIKNIYRLLCIILRLGSWTHSNDSQHLSLEGEACHTKRLNKTQINSSTLPCKSLLDVYCICSWSCICNGKAIC